jgi:hypothetical protein
MGKGRDRGGEAKTLEDYGYKEFREDTRTKA